MGLKAQRKLAFLIAFVRDGLFLYNNSIPGQAGKENSSQTEKKLLYYIHRRARSSAGRAPAWHAGGRKFDPCRVHHFNPRESGVFYVLQGP